MNYTTNLSSKFLEIAQHELGENEVKRRQLLELIRDWIKNHPHIKDCRQDDVFLLRFLRAKKFVYLNVVNGLENYLVTTKIFPEYFRNLDILDPELEELLDSGYIFLLPERDENGARNFYCQISAFDTNKFTHYHSTRLQMLLYEAVLNEEETQISGLNHLIDFSNMSKKYISVFPLSDLRIMLNIMQNSILLRLKSFYYINLPAFANMLLQFVSSVLSEKLRQRIKFLKHYEDLKPHVDISTLPKEYGGKKYSVREMVQMTKDLLLEKRELILKTMDTDMIVTEKPDWAVCSSKELEFGASGSFRLLEID